MKDIFKLINGQNHFMDQCKIVGTCKWRYYNICHIDGITFTLTNFWSAIAIPTF
jgi:hypothetical protein